MATICMMIKTVVDSEEGVNVGADCKPYLDLTMAAAKSNSSGNIDGCCDVPKEKNAVGRGSAPRDLCL